MNGHGVILHQMAPGNTFAINLMHIPGPALPLFSHTDSKIEISSCKDLFLAVQKKQLQQIQWEKFEEINTVFAFNKYTGTLSSKWLVQQQKNLIISQWAVFYLHFNVFPLMVIDITVAFMAEDWVENTVEPRWRRYASSHEAKKGTKK